MSQRQIDQPRGGLASRKFWSKVEIDRELVVVLIFPALVLVALLIALVRYASMPDAPAVPAPLPAPVVSSEQRRTPDTQQLGTPAPSAPPAPQPTPAQPVPQSGSRSAPESAPRSAPQSAPRSSQPAPSAPSQVEQRVHRVVAGDTLAKIALRYGVDYQRIATDNQLASARRIHVGQLLRIGAPTPGIRVIQPGDTLTDLAKATGVDMSRLLALNPWITNPNRIPAGAGLRVHT